MFSSGILTEHELKDHSSVDMAHDRAESDRIKNANQGNQATRQPWNPCILYTYMKKNYENLLQKKKYFLTKFLKEKVAYKNVITKPNQTIPMLPWLPGLPRVNKTHLHGFFSWIPLLPWLPWLPWFPWLAWLPRLEMEHL